MKIEWVNIRIMVDIGLINFGYGLVLGVKGIYGILDNWVFILGDRMNSDVICKCRRKD